MPYTDEQKAEAVAEYRLTGSVSHAARHLTAQRKTVRAWIRAAENPLDDQENRLAARALEIVQAKRSTLDAIYERAIELQLRDLPEADFRDRTGLIKIVAELRLLEKGKPTSIVQNVDRMDREIERMLSELAERDSAPA